MGSFSERDAAKALRDLGYRVVEPPRWFRSIPDRHKPEIISSGINPHNRSESVSFFNAYRNSGDMPDEVESSLVESGMISSSAATKPSAFKRGELAYNAHRAGMTWDQVGSSLGVSGSRAWALGKSHERRMNELTKTSVSIDKEGDSLDCAGLSARAKNCLLNAGVDSFSKLKKMSDLEIMALAGVGKVTKAEIRWVIEKHR